jgi:hypothetical protein
VAKVEEDGVSEEAPMSGRLKFDKVETFHLKTRDGGFTVPLGLSEQEGICVLSSVGGRFDDAADSVEVWVSEGVWVISLNCGGSETEITAKATVFRYED